jgi:predicted amidophosphoribosyltransferase
MKTNTRDNIYKYIKNNTPASIKIIQEHFWISKEVIHRHVKKLIEEGSIYKIWAPPKVYYFRTEQEQSAWKENWKNIYENTVEENFVYFWADGVLKYGNEWFHLWCKKRKLKPEIEVQTYIKTLEKYEKYKNKQWLINGLQKMQDSLGKIYLDKVYYLDFYSIEKYGKTMLGNLMFYAKQTGNKDLANKILEKIKTPIFALIKAKNIDSFAFIPPSIDRKIQLMDLIKKWLNINLKELKPIKIFKDTPVPQKSLNKKDDRVINARDTIHIVDQHFKSDTITLIDDAIWSGATLNETAKKIKDKQLAKKVIWLAIVWSYKWFEVISEV